MSKQFPPVSTHVIIASPERGKSTLISNLLIALRHAAKFVVVSGTDNKNHFYTTFLPQYCVFNRFTDSLLRGLLQGQTRLVVGKPPSSDPEVAHKTFRKVGLVVVFDDIAHQMTEIEKSAAYKELLINHRHYHTTLIYAIQDPVMISRVTRDLFRYVWCLAEPMIQIQRRLHDWYYGNIQPFSRFQREFIEHTDKHGAIMINKREAGDNMKLLTDEATPAGIYRFRAVPDLPAFTIGSELFWRLNGRKGFKTLSTHRGAYRENDHVVEEWKRGLEVASQGGIR